MPTGTVVFMDASTPLGTATLNSRGVAALVISTLATVSHSIAAVYDGDLNFTPSASDTLNQVVNKAASRTILVSSVNPSLRIQSVKFTATVVSSGIGAGTPTGAVTFNDGLTTLGEAPLINGTATFLISTLSSASHSITAVYSGDSNFTTSTSKILNQVVK